MLGAGCGVPGAGVFKSRIPLIVSFAADFCCGCGCWVLGGGCWVLGTGCWVLNAFSSILMFCWSCLNV